MRVKFLLAWMLLAGSLAAAGPEGADKAAGLTSSPEVLEPLVILDPAHDSRQAGTMIGKVREADLVFKLAARVAEILRAQGLRAELTRDAASPVSMQARIELANRLQAAAMVSLHVNYSYSDGSRGLRIFTSPRRERQGLAFEWKNSQAAVIARSRALAEALASEMLPASRRRRAVQQLPMALFRGLAVPAVVLELGFASHSSDLAALSSETYLENTAEEIARGVTAFLERPWQSLDMIEDE